jgi:hypothetical protein
MTLFKSSNIKITDCTPYSLIFRINVASVCCPLLDISDTMKMETEIVCEASVSLDQNIVERILMTEPSASGSSSQHKPENPGAAVLRLRFCGVCLHVEICGNMKSAACILRKVLIRN